MFLIGLAIVIYLIQHYIIPWLLFIGALQNKTDDENCDGDMVIINDNMLHTRSIGDGSRLFVYFHGNGGSLETGWASTAQEFYTRLVLTRSWEEDNWDDICKGIVSEIKSREGDMKILAKTENAKC